MTVATDAAPLLSIAGHSISSLDRAGGMLSLRVALHGGSLLALAQALARLDGVRVTGGPEGAGRERCYLAHCPGFKLVVSSPAGEDADFALVLVSRAPQAALSVMSDLGGTLERLMTVPPRLADLVSMTAASPLRRSSFPPGRGKSLAGGKPLAQGKQLARTKSLAQGKQLARTKSLAQGSSLAPGKPLAQGKPLARKTALQRRTPLGRGRFRSR